MRILIVGSREYSEPENVRKFVSRLPADTVVLTRCYSCAEKVAARTAESLGMQVVVMKNTRMDNTSRKYRDIALLAGTSRAIVFCDSASSFDDPIVNLAAQQHVTLLRIGPDGHLF